jgi:hypothetical protein
MYRINQQTNSIIHTVPSLKKIESGLAKDEEELNGYLKKLGL